MCLCVYVCVCARMHAIVSPCNVYYIGIAEYVYGALGVCIMLMYTCIMSIVWRTEPLITCLQLCIKEFPLRTDNALRDTMASALGRRLFVRQIYCVYFSAYIYMLPVYVETLSLKCI